MLARCRSHAFLLAVFLLPWVGVGLIHALTGRDLGGGLQPSWLFLALALMLGLNTLVGEMREGGLRPLLLGLTVLPLGALLLSAIGLWWAPSGEPLDLAVARWLRQVIQWLIMMAFVWGTVLHLKGDGSWQRVLDYLFWGVLFQVLYSGWMAWDFGHPGHLFASLEAFFTSNPSILASSERLYVNNQLQDFPRLRGTLCEPLYLGNFLVTIWPFLLLWRRPLLWRLVTGGLMAALLALTFSRGAWLAFFAQVPILALAWILARRQSGPALSWRWPVLALVTLILLLVGGDLATGGFFRLRLMATFNAQDWSNLTRLYSMQAAWQAFKLSPWLGIGWGQYAFHFPLLVDPMGLQSQFTWPVVNNYPLKVLCETGMVGFLVFLGSGIHLVRRGLGGGPSWGVPLNGMTGAALLGLWGAAVQLLTFSQYNLPHIWFGLGVLLAGLSRGKTSAGDEA